MLSSFDRTQDHLHLKRLTEMVDTPNSRKAFESFIELTQQANTALDDLMDYRDSLLSSCKHLANEDWRKLATGSVLITSRGGIYRVIKQARLTVVRKMFFDGFKGKSRRWCVVMNKLEKQRRNMYKVTVDEAVNLALYQRTFAQLENKRKALAVEYSFPISTSNLVL